MSTEAGWSSTSTRRWPTGLYAQARKNNASLFNVVYAGITSALRLLGGPADLLVGTSTSGRNDAEYFDTIGYFTTVVVHRVRFAEQLTVAGLIDQVKNTINGSMPYTDIPIDLVEEGLFGVACRSQESHV